MKMFGNWTVGRRLVTGFGLAGLTLLLIVIVAYQNTARTIENEVWVSHSHQVRTRLAELLFELVNGETGVRGYLIVGDEAFLGPYTSSLGTIQATLGDLRELTIDNPRQQARLTTIQPLVDAKFAALRQMIDTRRNQAGDARAEITLMDATKPTMRQLRSLIADADRDEQDLLKQRIEEAHASANMTLRIILWGGSTGAVAVTLIGWFMTRSLSRQIGSAVLQIQSSSAELQIAANQQATGAKEQSTAMTEVSTTINELLATTRQIAESARRVARNSEQTAVASRQGHGTVDLTHESIAGIRRQVDQIVAHMLELGKKSQEIGAVVEIVSELAEQTNILAINATIEAAGAGESGKRFAVVADEIRKLADRVAGSTKEIRTLVEDVRSAVNTTVMATETGSKAVDAGSRQFGDVASTFKQIAGLVATTTDAAREIELSTTQQSTAVEQVNVAIASVTQASAEMEISAGQTLKTSSLLADLPRDLMRIIQPHMVG
jgi:methyl-accepting chemotaxis protein